MYMAAGKNPVEKRRCANPIRAFGFFFPGRARRRPRHAAGGGLARGPENSPARAVISRRLASQGIGT